MNDKNINDLKFALAEQISLVMQQRGLSQAYLARLVGVSPSCVNKWVQGEELTINNLNNIAKALGLKWIVRLGITK